MSILDNITPTDVVDAIASIAKDVSVFAPPPVSIIAGAIATAGPLVEKLLRAQDAGVTADVLSKLLDDAMIAASDAQANTEFK
jgi:hypothetical protein